MQVMIKHTGGCHCRSVRFEVVAPADIEANECNCSICAKSGYLHLIVPRDRFKLFKGKSVLSTYTFNTETAAHYFCKICGIKSFYIPRSHPDGYSVNARCIDPGTIGSVTIKQSNGREWEKLYPDGRGTYRETQGDPAPFCR
jgi:hypothetical protein